MTNFGLLPGIIMIAGGLLLPFVPKKARKLAYVILPFASLFHFLWITKSGHGLLQDNASLQETWTYVPVALELSAFGQALMPVHVDALANVFAIIFHIAAIIVAIYSWHLKDRLEPGSALIYAGATIGAACAGDLITLFIYWELTAIASLLVVWAGRTPAANRAGMRYMIAQILSGLALFTGAGASRSAYGLCHLQRRGAVAALATSPKR